MIRYSILLRRGNRNTCDYSFFSSLLIQKMVYCLLGFLANYALIMVLMKSKVKVRGRIKRYLLASVILGLVLCLVDVYAYIENVRVGMS